MSNFQEKREFQRYSLNFRITVSSIDGSGSEFVDEAILADISGGGVSFITANREKYYLGQVISLSISLPATNDVAGIMQANAKVAGIRAKNPDASGTECIIGLALETPLGFERKGEEHSTGPSHA